MCLQDNAYPFLQLHTCKGRALCSSAPRQLGQYHSRRLTIRDAAAIIFTFCSLHSLLDLLMGLRFAADARKGRVPPLAPQIFNS